MKGKYAIVLLMCFVIPILASYAWLRYEKIGVKREIKQEVLNRIDLNDCAQFEFTFQQEMNLDWEHSTEFSYKGQKYDVILKKKTHSGTTLYYCWKDVKESAIDQKIASLVNNALGGNPIKDKQHKSVTHLVKHLPEDEPSCVLNFIPITHPAKGGCYRQFLSTCDLSVPSPPPIS